MSLLCVCGGARRRGGLGVVDEQVFEFNKMHDRREQCTFIGVGGGDDGRVVRGVVVPKYTCR
jgi:hypothetical protein